MLDDIVLAEGRAKALVDRLDSISRRKSIRVVDVDIYLWIVALIAIVAFSLGLCAGFAGRGIVG